MSSDRRAGFTLLEMLLAAAVSALLMGALYVAMDIQIRHTQAGRDVIEQSTLARALLSRITNDIAACVTPVAPTPFPSTSSTSPTPGNSAGAGSSDGSSSTAPASGSTNPSSSLSSSSSQPQRDTIEFNLGVLGNSSQLTLYASRLPRESNSPGAETLSDLRLINYWIARDGTRPLGLARREVKRVTGDDAGTTGGAGEAAYVIAEEVKSLQFRYFDGLQWQDSWDGTDTGWDWLTPVGPPVLIEIVLGIATPSGDPRSGGQPIVKYYRHSVSIPAADGVAR